MRRIGIIGLFILLTASGCATTGSVGSGPTTRVVGGRTVKVAKGDGGSVRAVIHGRLGVSAAAASQNTPKDLADAIVYVEGVDAKRGTAPQAVKVVTRNSTFLPHVTAVTVGTTVEFHNDDRVYHNAFSVSEPKRFKLGSKAPGEVRAVTFDRPGTVNYFCELHPQESGFVLVLPSDVYARADGEGAFALPPLPKGAYTVTAWHPHLGERRARVQLNGSDDVTLRLRF